MRRILPLIVVAFVLISAGTTRADEQGPTPEGIAFVQSLLVRFGYDPGPIDGVCGDLTVAAVRAFHNERGLPLEPGDIEPQAANVVKNLATAITEHVIRPKTKVGKVYLDALAGDAGAALEVGSIYHHGEQVTADNMIAYAWWSVAEKNGSVEAAMKKRSLAATGDLSALEAEFATSLAEQITPPNPQIDSETSKAKEVERLEATM